MHNKLATDPASDADISFMRKRKRSPIFSSGAVVLPVWLLLWLLMGCAVPWSALAYRPFVSTDASVADHGDAFIGTTTLYSNCG